MHSIRATYAQIHFKSILNLNYGKLLRQYEGKHEATEINNENSDEATVSLLLIVSTSETTPKESIETIKRENKETKQLIKQDTEEARSMVRELIEPIKENNQQQIRTVVNNVNDVTSKLEQCKTELINRTEKS